MPALRALLVEVGPGQATFAAGPLSGAPGQALGPLMLPGRDRLNPHTAAGRR